MKVPRSTARYAAKVTSRERGMEVARSVDAKAGAAMAAGAMPASTLGISIFMVSEAPNRDAT